MEELYNVRYNYDLVYDVYELKFGYVGMKHVAMIDDYIKTFYSYEEAIKNYPYHNIVARPTMATCCNCKVSTFIKDFHDIRRNHKKNCKYGKKTTQINS